ncbi:DeoR family transcriptional regulator [Spiroplasma corruscae]|uniref:DeoR family transcriptional regulator n=1 Tax=Spiroplasma corruscae TaxID=216934 RepID=A0A222EPI1_9MOLU|nr:DeoR/GlpR family DNA-binding transcription regulator [Spiroplasma corruscae]ASP28439.1 DeoR family transcriptional regulator [Spiroplasma corruscae]
MNKERLNIIWNFLLTKNTHTSRSILKFAKINNINEMTFRRDLHLLEKNNLIKLSYGYLEVISTSKNPIESIKKIDIKNIDLKEKVALDAINYIDIDDCIFVGAGSTCEIFTTKINKSINTFVTNGINILCKASKNSFIKNSVMVGGKLLESSDIICGSTSIKQIENFRFDKTFITAQSIDDKGNVYINNYHEYEFIIMLIKNSKKCFLLVDSSKLNHSGLIKVGQLDSFEKVIVY